MRVRIYCDNGKNCTSKRHKLVDVKDLENLSDSCNKKWEDMMEDKLLYGIGLWKWDGLPVGMRK